MKHAQRYLWLHYCEPRKLLAEYDAALANIEDVASTSERAIIDRVRRLPDAWRLLWYATIDGASAALIARKFGMSTSAVARRVQRVTKHVTGGRLMTAKQLAKRIDNIL